MLALVLALALGATPGPSVYVAMGPCLEAPARASWLDALALELATEGTPLSAEPEAALLALDVTWPDCAAAPLQLVLTGRDPARAAVVSRTLELDGVPPALRPRTLALVGAELVRALLDRPPPPLDPPPTPLVPAPDPLPPVVAPVAPTPAPLVVHALGDAATVSLDADVQLFPTGDLGTLGGAVTIHSPRLAGPLVLLARLGLGAARVRVGDGAIDVLAPRLVVGPALVASSERFALAVGPALGVGAMRMAGDPAAPGLEARAGWAATVDLGLVATLRARVSDALIIHAGLSVGHALVDARAADATGGSAGIATSGPAVGVAVGVGL